MAVTKNSAIGVVHLAPPLPGTPCFRLFKRLYTPLKLQWLSLILDSHGVPAERANWKMSIKVCKAPSGKSKLARAAYKLSSAV